MTPSDGSIERLLAEQEERPLPVVVPREVRLPEVPGNVPVLREIVAALVAANTNGFSVSRLHGALTSQGWKVGKSTLLAYLSHLVDAFLFFPVPLRSRSARQRAVNPRKVYALAAIAMPRFSLKDGVHLRTYTPITLAMPKCSILPRISPR